MKEIKLPKRLRYRNPVWYENRVCGHRVFYFSNGDIAGGSDDYGYRELTFNLG